MFVSRLFKPFVGALGCIRLLAATALIAFICMSGVAQAANIKIDDTNPNGSITISWADFEDGFSVNGVDHPFPGYGIIQSVTVVPTSTPVTFSGCWKTNGGSGG